MRFQRSPAWLPRHGDGQSVTRGMVAIGAVDDSDSK